LASMTGEAPVDPHGEIVFRYFRGQLESVQAVVFLFHGRGGDAPAVYEQLGRHVLRDDLLVIAPEAYSNCWYPYRFNEPESVNQPWLDSAIASIHREVSSLVEQGLDPAKLFFGGFSQGSCLALEYLLRYPRRYGGVFCLSGGVIGPEGTRTPLDADALQGTPVFLGCADVDDWIPRSKFDESVSLLALSGALVESRIYDDLGHSICEDELTWVQGMIDDVYAPQSPRLRSKALA
jgi:predicted esterase